jgi:hypothetical protein
MLNMVNLDELQRLLLCVPALVRKFEERDPGFADSVKAWLTQGEAILVNNRLPVAAGVATLRGTLISAERGVVPPGMVFGKRTTARRLKDAAAAEMMRRAEEVIASAISVDAARFAEGEKLIRQIVAVAGRKGLTSQVANPDTRLDMLRGLWQALTRDPDVGAATTHLVGLVGAQDALILLDRMMP